MAITYEPIATTTLNTTTASVTFSSISGSYTDLIIAGQIKGSQNTFANLQVGNGSIDTGNNYSVTTLASRYNSGTTEIATERYSSVSAIYVTGSTWYSSVNFGTFKINLQNYSNTTTYKTVLTAMDSFEDANYCGANRNVGLWRSTSAINILTISAGAGNLASGSTFTLYGIKAA